MKLSELVKKYKGEVRFDVNRIVDYDDEDVIVFKGSEVEAIKDSILNAEVTQFTVTGVSGGVPTINVRVLETADDDEGNNAPAAPDEGENKDEGGSEQDNEAAG